tara:strand:+ start:1879 stop:3030 length:1152 start_codon:yes stop_codon:yes gene_type:complete
MFLRLISYKKSKYHSLNKLFFLIFFTFGIFYKPNVISQPLANQIFDKESQISNSSFITKAIKKTGASVVTIDTQRLVKNRKFSRDSRIFIDPYFERFFGLQLPRENQPQIEQSQGSGFIFGDGLVMTNAHVVNKSEKLVVGLSNGAKYKGKLIGQDLLTDLAVIKLEGKGPWPKAILGDSTKIEVGDWAIAVGNPFGLENTVTLGIISNLNRNVSQLGIYDKKFELIQTDAAINPGNSGGPLLNSKGEVIGINTLIRSGPGAGLSFAIPINKAKDIASQLIKNGKVIHPMIGINLIDETYFETNKNIVKVGYVVPNSPAEKSGIFINDIILKVGKRDINNSSDVIKEISNNGINKTINIILKRKNKIIKLKVKPTDIENLSRK